MTKAEIRQYQGLIEANSSFIHYSDGFLQAPGYVDLSNLKFVSLELGSGSNQTFVDSTVRTYSLVLDSSIHNIGQT